ncbi:MAG: preprotein translocase subunit SecA [Rhodothermaceae bacterium]|nr:preprotein translocase subunit SecA [Rhodothermaceae bacterium]
MFDKLLKGFSKLFGSKSEKDVKKILPILEQIKAFEPEISEKTDDELKAYTVRFKEMIHEATSDIDREIQEIRDRIEDMQATITIEERRQLSDQLDQLDQDWLDTAEDVLDEIMPEAFAVLKETCKRHVGKKWMVAGNELEWNMVPYDVQLVGAIVLHQGKIAEMKTGEGKTLVAIFPTYLNALVGRGVHMVTVNTYLAQRDAEWNEPIFNFHGLTVDCIDRYQPNSAERRKAYRADVTYGTNNEFGFDYLRDNMVFDPNQLVQRHHHYTIIDEVDSVLIDEARTPLIISGPVPQDNQTQKYVEYKPRVNTLVEAQKRLIAKFLSEAEEALKNGDEETAGLALLRAQRGFPKSKKLQKMLQEPSNQKLLQQTEYFYLQDNARNMPVVDEAMYYAVNLKQNTIEMTDMGRDLITADQEDKEFFVIPDLGLETSNLEEAIARQEKERSDEILANEAWSREYQEKKIAELKEDLRKERNDKMSDLYRLFAERSERIHTVNQLLKSYTLFERDDEYIVQDGKVMIVDEHTGRVLSGRRYSDGLHQAIEAKENVKVEAATQTYATVTLQNYFRMYHKLAGMTGTAVTEEAEFFEIYKLEVIEIPTNQPIARDDRDDLVFRTKREKFSAILDKIAEYHEKGQPVLVGTTSVEVSETLSRMLKRSTIKHNVLNAKQHASESQIVAEAGQKGAVTIATNMAGRGTDIKLGKEVIELGGLAILGSERHESRRIDLQLRGRAGRQGDPGESQFFVSIEDDLMALFGDRISNVLERLKLGEGEVIQHPWVTKSLERAQSKVEQNNFSIRKRQLEFDDVLNNQRTVVYKRRRHALEGDKLTNDIMDMLEDLVTQIVEEHYGLGEFESIQQKMIRMLAVNVEIDRDDWSNRREDGVIDLMFEKAIEAYRNKETRLAEPFYKALEQLRDNSPALPDNVQAIFTDGKRRVGVVINVEKALKTKGREFIRALERSAVLGVIDEKWMEHLRELDSLKEGIGLRAFGQKDPLIEFKREAFNAFGQLMVEVNMETLSMIWKSMPEASDQGQIRRAVPDERRARYDTRRMKEQHAESTNMGFRGANGDLQANRSEDAPKQQPVITGPKLGRNDPCPLDPGKKFKHCCGAKGLKHCEKVGSAVT